MSTFPELSNIDPKIINNLQTGTKAGMRASQRVCWIRVFSGAKTGAAEGLIISSNMNYGTFNPSTTNNAGFVYGNSVSGGTFGTTWAGGALLSAGGPLRPSPGITGLQIKEGKDQISRECTLSLECFSLEQMELMQRYFLEPGYSLCIEYGWNSNEGISQKMPNIGTAEILAAAADRNLNGNNLHQRRVDSLGDYDTFLGFIVGGNVESDDDKWKISVKLRGAPGMPTFLQSQNKTLQINNTTGTTIETPGEPVLYDISDTITTAAIDGDDVRRNRRFKNMFNQLPTTRQIEAVRDLLNKNRNGIGIVQWYDFINFDAAVNSAITTYSAPGWWARTVGGATSDTITVGKAKIEKEKLFSTNKYIRFELAIDILNRNGEFSDYILAGKKLPITIDISNAKIGAFPNMFSTKASKLVIPGFMPDFSAYFLNAGVITQKAGGVFEQKGETETKEFPIVDNHIPTIGSFVQTEDTVIGPAHTEKGGYWGYLKNLYINFEVFRSKMEQKNKTIREVLLDMLNEMSSAVNSFWNFQVVEQQDKNGNIILSVVDENWIGKKKGGSVQFYHSGPYSIFLDASIDIALPSEMTNQIISRRLALANNPDEPIVGVGGFFESATDLFLTSYTDSNGNPKKILTEDEKKKQDEAATAAAAAAAAADKIPPSQKTQDKIDSSNVRDVEIDKAKSTLHTERRKLVTALDLVDGTVAANDFDIDGDEVLDPVKKAKIDAEIKALDAKIVALDAEKTANKEAREVLRKQKIEELKTEADADGEIAAKAIGANLEKIDVVPLVEKSDLLNIGEIQDTDVLKKNFTIFCMDDEPLFDKLKNDAFANKNKGTTEKGLSHPLPIKYTFKVLGTSGFRRGDTFNIIGIPTKYAKHGLFQITEIEHNVSGMSWTTSVTGQYRQTQ
jgi:hypothetical protein